MCQTHNNSLKLDYIRIPWNAHLKCRFLDPTSGDAYMVGLGCSPRSGLQSNTPDDFDVGDLGSLREIP